jgi:putative methanogenesis marker protein 14
MSLVRRLFKSKPKPRIVESPTVDILELKKDPYYVVASVEVGNSTTKCILTATNMKDGRTRIVNKTVKMTRDVRKPKPGEEVFAHTLCGTPLTRESVSELVRDTLLESHAKARLNIKEDLHFVVRSTGVVAGFSTPEEVGTFIQALADGCLIAGVPPRLMTPAMSIQNITDKFKPYSLMEKIVFCGPVASVFPPMGSTGVEIVANEMEGELATAGIKEGSMWTDVDFRNPCLSLDFGTTLDGRITSGEIPYSHTIGNFCGLAGAVPDALIQGTGLVDPQTGTTLDVFKGKKVKIDKSAREYAEEIDEYVTIEKVPMGRTRYGSVPVNASAAQKIGVVLIGCDVGENGSQLPKLSQIGREIHQEKGLNALFGAIDVAAAHTTRRLIEVAIQEGLVTGDTAIGITGRAGISGNKPSLILEEIEKLNLYEETEKNVVFVDDGLARGAAVMARCMNSMGTPRHPLGGVRGGKCILKQRIEYESKNL